MRVFVTGASGFIGKHVIKELLSNDHQVLALARTDVSAIALAATGAQVYLGDIENLDSLRDGASKADGAIHLAFGSPVNGFDKACEVDRAAIRAMGEAFAGTGKPLVIASGTIGVAKNGEIATEDMEPRKDLPISVRYESADVVYTLAKEQNVRGIVVRLSALVHGKDDKGGFVPSLAGLAKKNGRAVYVEGAGARWPAVHVDDAARLFRLALEKGKAGATHHAVADEGVEVKQIMELIGKKLGLPVGGVSSEEAEKSLGFFSIFVGMDGRTSSEKTRLELGWQPREVSLLEDMEKNYVW